MFNCSRHLASLYSYIFGKFHCLSPFAVLIEAINILRIEPQSCKIVNEIVLRTMKSERGSDEIFSLRLQMKLNPSSLPAKRDFIAKRFHPPKVDLSRPQGRI